MLNAGYGEGQDFDEDSPREDWQEHRDDLVDYWTQSQAEWLRVGEFGFAHPRPGGPGTRPWAWWAFASPPELRERLAREGWAPIYEDIRAVLKRHRALLPGEKEA
jgi:hypothetical protein